MKGKTESVGKCVFWDHPEHRNEVCKAETCFDMRTGLPCMTGSAVIARIMDEIEAGDAPMYSRNDIVKFFRWLHTNNDIFDIHMMRDAIDNAEANGLTQAGIAFDEHEDLVKDFVTTLGKE